MSDERIATACPNCAARLRVPSKAAGKRVRCPKCGVPFAVAPVGDRDAGPVQAGDHVDNDLLAGLASGTAVESPEERVARHEARMAEAARAGKRSAQADAGPVEMARTRPPIDWGAWTVAFGRGLLPVSWPSRVCLAALLFGGIFIWHGFREGQLRTRSREEPQILSCAELLAQGPGDNLHVALTDFVLLPDYVYEQKSTRWNGAWVPAVPIEAVQDALAKALKVDVSDLPAVDPRRRKEAADRLSSSDFGFKLVVAMPKADGQDYVERMYEQETIDGLLMVDGYLTTLGSEQQRILERAYPRADLDECWVLIEGRRPFSHARAAGYEIGGAGLVLAALVFSGWRATGEARAPRE